MRNMFMATILLADDTVPSVSLADVPQVALRSLGESCIERWYVLFLVGGPNNRPSIRMIPSRAGTVGQH